MAISVQEKYLRLKERLKDPIVYAAYRKKCLEKQRQYARDPEYCKKRALSTADWRFRKARGLPTRPRTRIKPIGLVIPQIPQTPKTPENNFDFQLVSAIQVEFS